MPRRPRVVFLVDVDNTLLDNDRVERDLRRHLDHAVGHARRRRYFRLFERLRAELGYADYLGALQRYRLEYPHDHRLLTVSTFMLEYPFDRRLYPRALQTLRVLERRGPVVILSDGDAVFQPLKIERSGIARAAKGRVLVYVHKERELGEVARLFPADHYVLVDDKRRILAVVKRRWGKRVTTVWPRQGHYARQRRHTAPYPPADVAIGRIGALAARRGRMLA